MEADESVLAAIPKIGNALAHSMKARFGSSGTREVREDSEEDEDAMLDTMAAEYGEAVAAEKSEQEDKKGPAGPRQSNLFDF
jgi:hypothetical protein